MLVPPVGYVPPSWGAIRKERSDGECLPPCACLRSRFSDFDGPFCWAVVRVPSARLVVSPIDGNRCARCTRSPFSLLNWPSRKGTTGTSVKSLSANRRWLFEVRMWLSSKLRSWGGDAGHTEGSAVFRVILDSVYIGMLSEFSMLSIFGSYFLFAAAMGFSTNLGPRERLKLKSRCENIPSKGGSAGFEP